MLPDRHSLLRPETLWIDPFTCVECGICEEYLPASMLTGTTLPVTTETLEAMSACPTGAIRWLEGKENDESD